MLSAVFPRSIKCQTPKPESIVATIKQNCVHHFDKKGVFCLTTTFEKKNIVFNGALRNYLSLGGITKIKALEQ